MRSVVDSSSRPPPEPVFADGPSVRMALAVATADLRDAGCGSPRLDAELLLADALGGSRTLLHLRPERELTREESDRFARALGRRKDREPVAYILGTRAFRHVDLAVDPRVLIPRPETELLVEVGLTLPHGARVADVGTGSGAIALALKHERPDLQVVATDVSVDALEVARANAHRLGLQVEFREGDLTAPLQPASLDAIVSNPPYVPARAELAPELDHEPAGALYAGDDGLDTIRRLIPQALALAPLLVLEVGAGQAAAVAKLMRAAGATSTSTHRDLAGIERMVVGRR